MESDNDSKEIESISKEIEEEPPTKQVGVGLEYPCKYCRVIFQVPRLRKIHERSHMGKNKYQCRFCAESFAKQPQRVKHELMHGGPFKCNFCEKIFDYKSTRTNHERSHVTRTFKCIHCDEAFLSKAVCKMHQQTHIPPKSLIIERMPRLVTTFQCHSCERQFMNKTTLMIHEKSHVKLSRPPAPSNNKLKKQRAEKAPVVKRKRRKTESTNQLLQRLYNGVPLFQCVYCDALVGVRTIHDCLRSRRKAPVYNFKCGFCRMTFINESHRERHEITLHGTNNSKESTAREIFIKAPSAKASSASGNNDVFVGKTNECMNVDKKKSLATMDFKENNNAKNNVTEKELDEFEFDNGEFMKGIDIEEVLLKMENLD